MLNQIEFDFTPKPFTAESLRNTGMKMAEDHANQVTENWSETAYRFLLHYIQSNGEFMAEDVRAASIGIVTEPPSNRAWGGVIARAAKNKIIVQVGYGKTSNPKAHKTPASIWQRNKITP